MERTEHARRPVGAFIFDLDGTLVDSRRDIAAATNVARAAVGLPPLDEGLLCGYVGDGVMLLLRRALGHGAAPGGASVVLAVDDPQLAPAHAAYVEHYGRHLLDHTRAFEGVPATLRALGEVPMMVATNKPGDFSRAILAGLGLDGYIRRVVGGDEAPARKPDAAHLRACLEGLDVAPRDVVVVGDSSNDILAARALGAVAVGCAWGLNPREELRALQPDHLIESLSELAALYALPRGGHFRETP